MGMWERRFDYYIVLAVLVAGITKRAQFPFSRWLPAAMAAPTPVSALVHSSTLVTAGVFLLIRFYNYISQMFYFERVLLVVSCVTIFLAAFSAIMETDLKKIIALSTLSQLGVMMASLAVGLPKLALFHLATHALFKALLFICAGSFIFLHSHNQDLRLVGNLSLQLPLTRACFIIGRISLCGLPFLAGFYSKDLILEVILSRMRRMVIMRLIILATGATAFYRMRLANYRVLSPRFGRPYHNLTDEDKNIILPCLNLTLGAIFGGAAINWLLGPFRVETFIPLSLKLMPLYLRILGAIFSFKLRRLITVSGRFGEKFPLIHEFICSMWFLSPLRSQGALKFLKPAYYYLSVVDHGWVEGIRAQGAWGLIKDVSQKIQPVQGKIVNIMLSLRILSVLMLLVIFCLDNLNFKIQY